MTDFDVIVIGGGAAGFYGAIHMASSNPGLKIAILEKSGQVLSKVKISGGGRCNVTHAIYDPLELTTNYPRGQRELLGPFHRHGSSNTVAFFEKHGIRLKTEPDGRIFPVSNSSQTIISLFVREIDALGVTLLKKTPVTDLAPIKSKSLSATAGWKVHTTEKTYTAGKVLLATGSDLKIWNVLRKLDYRVEPAIPSLFTFNITDERISGLQGVSTPARVEVLPRKPTSAAITLTLGSRSDKVNSLVAEGPLLITHWGMSGPAILKLSAWGALVLNACNYHFTIRINWLPYYHMNAVLKHLKEVKEVESRKTVLRTHAVDIPRRLWINLVLASEIPRDMIWSDLTKKQMEQLAHQLTRSEFRVVGKSTFKEEFVTAGGVDLKEVNFKTFESRRHANLYFAGEILNVDAVTGGFNFQNAWTGAYLAAIAIAG